MSIDISKGQVGFSKSLGSIFQRIYVLGCRHRVHAIVFYVLSIYQCTVRVYSTMDYTTQLE